MNKAFTIAAGGTGRHVLAAALALWVALVGPALGDVLDLKVEYAAESTIGTGERARPGRLWRTPSALRHETVQANRVETVIVRLDRGLAWLLVPELSTAIEMEMSAFALAGALADRGAISQSVVGTETIGGSRATKYRVRGAGENAGSFDGFVWTRSDGVVLRIDGMGESLGQRGPVALSFQNVRVGKQDPALFEVPASFRRLAVRAQDAAALIDMIQRFSRPRP
jgi:hypothetical protein